MTFPEVMYRSESWTTKKAEFGKIDAFELQCWRRPLKVPWTARRSNQSILKEINPDYSLEGLMLKLPYFVPLMPRVGVFEKTQMLGKTEGKKKKGCKRMRWLESITDSVAMNLSCVWEIVKDRGAWWATVHGVTKSRTQLSN